MSSRYPRRSRFPSRRALSQSIGDPKFSVGDVVGDFRIMEYMGHSDINKRNNRIMAKPQHWYHCQCTCGTQEHRSQQELGDERRSQCCYKCRSMTIEEERRKYEDSSGRD